MPPKVSTLLKTSLLAWEPSPDPSTHLKPGIPNLFISERERFLHDSKSAPCHQVKLLLLQPLSPQNPEKHPRLEAQCGTQELGGDTGLADSLTGSVSLGEDFFSSGPLFPKAGIAKIPTAQSCCDLFNKICIQVEYS